MLGCRLDSELQGTYYVSKSNVSMNNFNGELQKSPKQLQTVNILLNEGQEGFFRTGFNANNTTFDCSQFNTVENAMSLNSMVR